MEASTFREQKVPDSKKTPEWFKDCHNWIENKTLLSSRTGYSSRNRLINNRQFYEDGTISKQEIASIVNPKELQWTDIPDGIPHHPIAKPYILPLKGEELKRRFDWAVAVSSRDAISEKELQRKELVDKFIISTITNDQMDEDRLQEVITDFMDDQHSWQDMRETGMTELLKYYWEYLDLKGVFSDAWDKELIEGKAVIDVDEYNNIPCVEVIPSACVFTPKAPGTHFIEDIDMVAIEQYLPVSVVKDRYYEFLSPKDIDYLDRRLTSVSDGSFGPESFYDKVVTDNNGTAFQPTALRDIHPYELQYEGFRGFFDGNGNVRVSKTRWIGERRVAFLNYFDDDGVEQEIVVPDDYTPDPLIGERVRYRYINEAYESTKVGEDIFIKQQVRNVQFRKLDNKSYCSLGIIGIEYDKSVFEAMKPLNVKYNTYMWKLDEAYAKTFGNIGVLDIAMIPDGWDVEKTMYYASKMGWMVVDSFKEGNKGKSMGKMAGELSGQQRNIVIEQYQFIDQCFKMLQYIEMQLDKLFGINAQRRGLVEQDAGLGTTQEAVQASLNATEWYYSQHDKLKLKTLRLLGAVAKFCLRNGSETLQYVASDATLKMFKVDGDEINDADYNILIVNSKIDEKAEGMLQEGIKIGFQSGQVDLLQMMDIYSNDSIASIRRKLTKSIKQNQRQKQQQEEQVRKHEAELQAKVLQDKQLDRDLTKYKIDQDNQTKLATATISALGFAKDTDADSNGVADVLEQNKLALEQQKHVADVYDKQQKLIQEKEIKDKEHSLKEKELSTKKEIENKKLQQVATQNKSQELIQKRQADLKEKELKTKILIERIKAKSKPKVKKS